MSGSNSGGWKHEGQLQRVEVMAAMLLDSVIESKTVLVEKLGFSVTLTQLCYWYRDAVTHAESYQVAVLNEHP